MATGELVEEVGEEVAENLEEMAEVARRVDGRSVALVLLGTAAGAAIGGTVGFIVAKSKLETKYEKLAEEEISQMREHYFQKLQAAEAAEEKPSPAEVVKGAGYTPYSEIEPSSDAGPKEPAVVVEKGTVTDVTNVFATPQPETPEWDQEAEESQRSSTHPYIIHKDEYKANEKEYDQMTWTYYSDDDVLANDVDRPVNAVDGYVPVDFAEKFGHGSGDPNVVYVRNDELSIELEIIRNPGNFAEVVHGFLQHSASRARRHKPRFDDEG